MICVTFRSDAPDHPSAYATNYRVHQTLHLLVGFIGVPAAQPYVSAKSREFDSGPRTRTKPGECTDERILFSASSGRIEPHQICA